MRKRLFAKEDTYEDIKQKLEDILLDEYEKNDKCLIEEGVKAFSNIKDKKRIENYFKRVDELYTTKKGNIRRTIPIILYGSIVLYHYEDFAKELNDDALALFCHNNYQNTYQMLETLEETLTLTSPKILEIICKKTKDVLRRSDYYALSEDLITDKNISQEKRTKQYICDKIKEMTKDEYKVLYKKYLDYPVINKIIEDENIIF